MPDLTVDATATATLTDVVTDTGELTVTVTATATATDLIDDTAPVVVVPDYSEEDLVITQSVTTTVDGLGSGVIAATTTFANITSSDADYIATLPTATVGKVLRGWVGATGCELRTPAASNETINGADMDGTNELAVPANTGFVAECFVTGTWILTIAGQQTAVQTLSELQAAITAGTPSIEIGADIDLTAQAAPFEVPAVLHVFSRNGYTLSNCSQTSIFNCGSAVTSLTVNAIVFTGNAIVVHIESEGSDMKLNFQECSGSANTDHILSAEQTESVTMRKVSGLISGNDFDLNRHHFLLFDSVGLENIHVERNKLATARKASISFGQSGNYGNYRRGIWVCNNECSDVDDQYDAVDSGTTDGTNTNELIDSKQTDFLTTVSNGDTVLNTTDGTFTTVASVDSNTVLTLNSDIMTTGQDYVILNGNEEAHHIFVRGCKDVFICNNKLSEVHTQYAIDNRVDNEAIYTKSSRAVIDGNVIHNGGYTSIAFKGNQDEVADSLIDGWNEESATSSPGDRSIITNNIITYSDDYITARGTDHKGNYNHISGSLLVCNNSFYDVSYGVDLKIQPHVSTDAPHVPGTVTIKNNYMNGCSVRGVWIRPGAGYNHLSISNNKFVNQAGTGLLLRCKADSVIDTYDWNILGNEISGTPSTKMSNGITLQFENQATGALTFDGVLVANNVIKYAVNGIKRYSTDAEPINAEPGAVITNIDVGEGRLETASVLGQNYFFDITTADYSGWVV